MQFTLNGVTYESNEKGNRFFKTTDKTDAKGNHFKVRIGEAVFEQAFDEFKNQVNEADENWDTEDEIKERKDAREKEDRKTEESFNGKNSKGKKKPRKSKDIGYAHQSGVTLTDKQVDFMKHLPDTCFWEHGLDSALWCDVLADEIGGQFADKPMTVGAMISTLREKNVISVAREDGRQGKPKFMVLTELGKEIAKELGLI